MHPTAVIEFISAIGSPFFSRSAYIAGGVRRSSRESLSSSIFLILSKQIPAEKNVAAIVAAAAPSTPVCSPKMHTQSRMIFTTDETIIALNGVLLSPRALSMQALMLYAIVAVSPPKMIYPYLRLSSIMISEVCMSIIIFLRNSKLTAVRNADISTASFMDAAKAFFSALMSFAP